MERRVTLIDPGAYNKAITIDAQMTLMPDTGLLEYVCAETPRERFHLTSRTDAERALRVPLDVLARYVGIYDMDAANPFGIRTLTISLAGDHLMVDFNGKGRMPLIPLSPTMFSPRLLGTYEFVTDAQGVVTHLLAHGAEGSLKAIKRGAGPPQ